jgi:hypothetical protein
MSIYTPDVEDDIFIEMRLWMKKNPLTENDIQCDKIPAWNKGIPNSPETRRLCGIAAKKKVFTDEMRENYRQSKLGDKNPNYKKPMPEEQKEKLRTHMTGKKLPIHSDWHKNNDHHTKHMMVCPHCNIIGKGMVMQRWHFDNCNRKS